MALLALPQKPLLLSLPVHRCRLRQNQARTPLHFRHARGPVGRQAVIATGTSDSTLLLGVTDWPLVAPPTREGMFLLRLTRGIQTRNKNERDP